jgi:cobyrinic acid a,c-diamide synthase
MDSAGTHSTAQLARLLGAPVVLVVDTTKRTRTVAAMVLGCQAFDPDLRLAGVVLNRVATGRQERVIRDAVESLGVPVLGAIPRLAGDDPMPGRHLGLVTVAENARARQAIERAEAAVLDHVDLDALVEAAARAPAVALPEDPWRPVPTSVRVAYVADAAFSFYYPENLERLAACGAELVPVSPAADRVLPPADALYVGGGFPEEHAARLADCTAFAASLRAAVAGGMPVYAECGGLMYLARELVVGGASHPMAGVLDLVVEQTRRPQGHGYVEARVDRANPFFDPGTELRGHEFHYSRPVGGADRARTVLCLGRGTGLGDGRDGIVAGRVWASYLHLHAGGAPQWVDGMVRAASAFAAERAGGGAACGCGSG